MLYPSMGCTPFSKISIGNTKRGDQATTRITLPYELVNNLKWTPKDLLIVQKEDSQRITIINISKASLEDLKKILKPYPFKKEAYSKFRLAFYKLPEEKREIILKKVFENPKILLEPYLKS